MTALDFYKKRLKERGFDESQIKELTEHKDLPWIKFAEDYVKAISVTRCCKSDSDLLMFMEHLSTYYGIDEVIDCTKHQQVIEQYKP